MIEADIRAIALARGLREVALGDVIRQFPDDGITSLAEWLESVRAEKPHWFAVVTDGTENEAVLTSLSAQGTYVREHGEAAARELLARNGLKLGEIKAPTKDEPPKGANNPFDLKAWRGTPAEREARIASIIKSGGTRFAASLAKSAGVSITGQPLKK